MLKVVLLALFAHAINGQSDSCNTSRTNFLNEYPDCLEAFEGAVYNVSRGYGVGNAATDLICVDTRCRMAIADYTNSCITDKDQVVKAQHQLYTFGCILLSEGEACFDKVTELEGGFEGLLTEVTTILETCQSEYLTGICSEYCVQSIIALVDKLDCCYSEAIRSISSMLSNQHELALAVDTFTRGYFLLCGLEVPTFCQDAPPPTECSAAIQELFGSADECVAFARQILTGDKGVTSSNWPGTICLASILKFSDSCDIEISVTEECMTAADELFASNDSCTQAFTAIPDNITANISFEQVDRALDTVCGAVGCKNRVIDFTESCLSEIDRQQYELFVLRLGCRTNFNGSCTAQLSLDLNDANSGICFAAVLGVACPPGCASAIEKAVNEIDCCVYEVGQAGLDLLSDLQQAANISIDGLFSTCGITNPGRCDEQTEGTLRYAAIDADDDDDDDTDDDDDNDDDNDNDNIDDDDDDDIDDGNDGGGASLIVGCTMLILLLALLPILTV